MKKYFLLVMFSVLFFSCSKEEEKLELFSAEAFAYSMDSGWEVNASCRVKGFEQNEENEQFKVKLSFTVDMQNPEGKLFKGVGKGLINQVSKEKFSDLPIETQIQLDSTYKSGNYSLTFNVTDNLSGKTVLIKKKFELLD